MLKEGSFLGLLSFIFNLSRLRGKREGWGVKGISTGEEKRGEGLKGRAELEC